jgi:hypothetical protein
MKNVRYVVHRYATPDLVKIILALLTLVTFALAGGAPEDNSGPG